MNFARSCRTTLGLAALSLALTTASASAAQTYQVTIDTASLAGLSTGPFSLDLQLNYGSGTGNSATVSNFSFGGGAATGTASLFGSAAGDMTGTVTMSDNTTTPFNEVFQGFTPGATLSFNVTLSSNVAPTTPDAFEVAILDNTLGQIPTTEPTGNNDPQSGTDGLSLVDFEISGNGAGSVIAVHAYPGANNPSLGGDYTGVTVNVQAVPEPSAWMLGAVCVALFAWLRRRSVRA